MDLDGVRSQRSIRLARLGIVLGRLHTVCLARFIQEPEQGQASRLATERTALTPGIIAPELFVEGRALNAHGTTIS